MKRTPRCNDCGPVRLCPTHRLAQLRVEVDAAEASKPRCPACGCTGKTCAVHFADGSEGLCVPAGVVGLKVCSACDFKGATA